MDEVKEENVYSLVITNKELPGNRIVFGVKPNGTVMFIKDGVLTKVEDIKDLAAAFAEALKRLLEIENDKLLEIENNKKTE